MMSTATTGIDGGWIQGCWMNPCQAIQHPGSRS